MDANFSYYVKWPARRLLHDLIIIPYQDITFKKDTPYTSGAPDTTTAEMYERELTINLIQVSEITAYPPTNIPAASRSDTDNEGDQNPNVGGGSTHQVFRNRHLPEDHAATLPNTTEVIGGDSQKTPLRGIIHRGRYMQLNRSCPYLIREFPIMAAPAPIPGADPATPQTTTWGKHTPIYAIQNGQPLQILHDTTANQPTDKKTYHQHETCRSTKKLRHGSLDSNQKFAISKEHSTTGEVSEPGNTRNSANTTLRAKKLKDDSFIESTDFSYSHSKRRDGSQVQHDELDPRFNALTRISTGMFNFNDDIRGCVENPFSNFEESSSTKPTLMKKGASGTFYNSSNEDQFLMLNIGQNSHYKNTYRGGSGGTGNNDYDNTRPAASGDLNIGGADIVAPDSNSNTGVDDNETSRRELNLRFKAIFIFKQIDDV